MPIYRFDADTGQSLIVSGHGSMPDAIQAAREWIQEDFDWDLENGGHTIVCVRVTNAETLESVRIFEPYDAIKVATDYSVRQFRLHGDCECPPDACPHRRGIRHAIAAAVAGIEAGNSDVFDDMLDRVEEMEHHQGEVVGAALDGVGMYVPFRVDFRADWALKAKDDTGATNAYATWWQYIEVAVSAEAHGARDVAVERLVRACELEERCRLSGRAHLTREVVCALGIDPETV